MNNCLFKYQFSSRSYIRNVIYLLLFLCITPIQAQFTPEWDKIHGGPGYEELTIIYETPTGFIMFGSASAAAPGTADQPATYGSSDYWVYTTDEEGNYLNGYVYGGTERDILTAVLPLADGGYLLGGFSNSGADGSKTEPIRGDRDMWVVRIDANGVQLWDKTLGGDEEDYLDTMIPTDDGGFLLGGWTYSTMSGEVSEDTKGGPADFWLVKIDGTGGFSWDRRYGGDDIDLMQSMVQTTDGNYILFGQSGSSTADDKTAPYYGSIDIWAIKIDPLGNEIWQNSYGGDRSEEPSAALLTSDGDILVGGYSRSPVSGNKTAINKGDKDYWLLRIDTDGNKIWDRSYGGDNPDEFVGLKRFKKNQIAMVGLSSSPISGDKTEANRGWNDYWLFMVDEDGNELYQKTMGGDRDNSGSGPFIPGHDNMQDAIQLEDGSIIMAGFTVSETGLDITADKKGIQDNWVVKLGCDVTVDIGPDIVVCLFEQFTIDATVPDACTYEWSDGGSSAIRTLIPDMDRTYIVTVTDVLGCEAYDTLNVRVKSLPQGELGNDITICTGDSTELNPMSDVNNTFLWNTGDTTATIFVKDAGNYSVTITNDSLCQWFDNINVSLYDLPDFDLGPDQVICPGDDITLMVNHPGPVFSWSSTTLTSQSITVDAEDRYYVTVTDLNNCSAIDSIDISFFPQPSLSLGNDTTICAGRPLVLDATAQDCPGCTYTWNDMNNNPIRTVIPTSAITYSVVVSSSDNCTASDEINIGVNQLPTANMGPNVEICEGDSVDIVFNLTGANPFNIIYDDGLTPTSLFDIENGHTIRVGPSQTTTYSIILIEDSAIPEACTGFSGAMKTINVYQAASTTVPFELCEGDSLFAANEWQFETGIFMDTLQTIHNCDSVVITDLTVFSVDTTYTDDITCFQENEGLDTVYYFNQYNCESLIITDYAYVGTDTMYFFDANCDPNLAGIDTTSYLNQYGCDSTVIMEMALLPSDTFRFSFTSCFPDSVGIDTMFYTNQYGCDSLIIHNTTLVPTDIFNFSFTSCDTSMVGIDTLFYTNQYGCDSLIINTTNLLPSDTIRIGTTSCIPEEAGVDTTFLNNQYGCDSLVILQTNYVTGDTIRNNFISCDPMEVGADTTFLMNQFDCDSLIINTTSLVLGDTIQVGLTTCDPSEAGVDTTFLLNQFQCDSLIIMTTVLLPSDTTYLSATTCEESEAGTDMLVLTNIWDCDSTIFTITTFVDSDTTYLSDTTCDPLESGQDTMFLMNQFDCDSLVITSTALLPSNITYLDDVTTCDENLARVDTTFLMNQFDCDSLVILTTNFIPPDTTYLMESTCDQTLEPSDSILMMNQYGCDSLVITDRIFLLSDTIYLDEFTCDMEEIGNDTMFLTNYNNCDSLIITTIMFAENDTTFQEIFTCNIEEVGADTTIFNTILCDSIVIENTLLMEDDSTFLFTQSCYPADVGVFVSYYTNVLGCDSVVLETVELTDEIEVFVEEYSCNPSEVGEETFLDTAINGCDSITYVTTLLGTDTTYFSEFTCFLEDTGIFTETFPNQLNCDSVIITEITLIPTNVTVFSEFTCDPEEVVADTTVYVGTQNCDSIVIFETVLLQMDIQTDLNGLSCAGESDGSIIVMNTEGGLPPYLYALNEGAFSSNLSFNGLSEGDYTLTVQDANGCETTESFVIEDISGFDISIGNDTITTILFGDSIMLNMVSTQPLDTFYWNNTNTLSCLDCTNPYAMPLNTTLYQVTGVNADGCEQTDVLTVIVSRNQQVFIPSAFSPNNDGINDYLGIFAGPGVAKVKSFHVFDRWGECLFEKYDFFPNDISQGWDGQFRGKYINPSVLVYWAEIEFIDGLIEIYKGDVTLMR